MNIFKKINNKYNNKIYYFKLKKCIFIIKDETKVI